MRPHVVQLAERRREAQHPGLLLTRFCARDVAGDKGDPEEKRALLRAAVESGRHQRLIAIYKLAFERWRAGVDGVKAELELQTPPSSRLIVGLGNKGVIEAGLRLHHTYGVPLIPGSALKGLAAHYCHDVWGVVNPRYGREGDYHALLFGTTEDGGAICFSDAWMHPDSLLSPRQGLRPDVMTPHHQKWQTDPEIAPTDFDSPVPVPFLSVAGCFQVAVCWQGSDDPRAEAWTKRTLAILEEALKEWGVGGKTSSGYGRLVRPKAEPARGSAKKRDANTPARVTIVGARGNGGFDVTEEGRNPGVINPTPPPPAGTATAPNSVVDVLVNNDDPKKPQYKWPAPTRR